MTRYISYRGKLYETYTRGCAVPVYSRYGGGEHNSGLARCVGPFVVYVVLFIVKCGVSVLKPSRNFNTCVLVYTCNK